MSTVDAENETQSEVPPQQLTGPGGGACAWVCGPIGVKAAAAGVLLLWTSAWAISTYQQELEAARRSKPDLDRGAELFQVCAACHGRDGSGARNGSIPRIGGQLAPVLVKQLVDYRYARRWDPRMESVAGAHHLSAAQSIADVAAYVASLAARGATGVGDGDLVELGAERYQRDCAQCHGPEAAGDARRLAPRLAGQHYEYLRRQIYDAVDGRRPNFSAAHIRLLARLEHDDIAGIADYLARLSFPVTAAAAGELSTR